jgi:hypothetical protein
MPPALSLPTLAMLGQSHSSSRATLFQDCSAYTNARYLLETTIMDARLVVCPSSFLAARAYCLARLLRLYQSRAHVYYSWYTYSQLHSLMSHSLQRCTRGPKHHRAVYDKFSCKQCRLASLSVEEKIRKGLRPPEPTNEKCTLTRAVYGILVAKGNSSQSSNMLTALPLFQS